jgi:hypothetical protein
VEGANGADDDDDDDDDEELAVVASLDVVLPLLPVDVTESDATDADPDPDATEAGPCRDTLLLLSLSTAPLFSGLSASNESTEDIFSLVRSSESESDISFDAGPSEAAHAPTSARIPLEGCKERTCATTIIPEIRFYAIVAQ